MSVEAKINQAIENLATLDHFDPNWEYAKKHGQACNPGIDKFKQTDHHMLCSCCLNSIHKDPIPLCEHSKELEFLGFGFPLYYMFMKYATILLLVLVMNYSIIGLYWATDPELQEVEVECFKEACPTWLLWISRLEKIVYKHEIVARFTSFFMHMLGLLFFRNLLQKSTALLDQSHTSMSDYSIMMKRIPQQLGIRGKTETFFQNYFSVPVDVKDIILINEIEKYYEIEHQKQELIEKYRPYFKNKDQASKQKFKEKTQEFDRQIRLIHNRIQVQYQDQLTKITNDEVMCDKIIVVINTEAQKNQILQQFGQIDKKKLKDFFQGETDHILMAEAPQPKQIHWEHLNYPYNRRLARLFLADFLFLITLAIVSVIFFFCLQAKSLNAHKGFEQIRTDHEEATSILRGVQAGVFCVIFAIILFNKFILSKLLHFFTDIEFNYTGSKMELSFCQKYAFGLFWTTACMTLLVEDARFHNIYDEKWGVIEEQSIMFFLTAFFVPIIWLVNPWVIWNMIQQKLNYGRTDYTQKQANSLMQKQPYSMGKRYAQILESMWFAFFYSSVIPIGPMLLICGFICYYWIDKFNLLRRSSVQTNVSAAMPLRAMKLLDLTLLFKPLGEIVFDTQIRDGICYQSIVCISIAAVYVIIPLDVILDFFLHEKFNVEQKTYEEVKHSFHETYRTLHPLYHHQRKTIIKTSMKIRGKKIEFLDSHHDLVSLSSRAHLESA